MNLLKPATKRIKYAILDFSGTCVDQYVVSPAVVFCKVFEKYGVPISMEESRGPMGLRKDLHINQLLANPDISRRWEEVHGVYPTAQKEGKELFKHFVPMQLECLDEYSTLIPGTKEAVDKLRDMGMKIGLTTGFTREMVDVLESNARKQGLEFDCTVAGDEVLNGGRPSPHMLYKNLDLLGVDNIDEVVKVDDVVGGIGEGLNARCLTIGLSRYSNYMDIDSLQLAEDLTEEQLKNKEQNSRRILENAGAHVVCETIKEIPGIIERWNKPRIQMESNWK